MSDWWKIVFAVLCGFLGAGIIFLATSQPGGEAILLQPAPTPGPLAVHVAGAVAKPGVYLLPAGSRVLDAIQAAGDILPAANTDAINLAEPLQDGARITVPEQGQEIADPVSQQAAGERSITVNPGTLININTATIDELDTLPGIGPVTAEAIIRYREANGLFETIQDILDVPGIGDVTFEKIRHLITVEP